MCEVISNWTETVDSGSNGLTRYNLIILSDVCVPEEVFNITYNDDTKYQFPGLQSTYNYFVSSFNGTCKSPNEMYTFFSTNVTNTRCNDSDGLCKFLFHCKIF